VDYSLGAESQLRLFCVSRVASSVTTWRTTSPGWKSTHSCRHLCSPCVTASWRYLKSTLEVPRTRLPRTLVNMEGAAAYTGVEGMPLEEVTMEPEEMLKLIGSASERYDTVRAALRLG
jgi:hypothetical protein